MKKITLVTSNAGKLAEWKRLLPADFPLESTDIDLDEIQSLDLEAIVIDKAKRAYAQLGTPVLVEDVSAGLVSLGGLPGPFIKFFEVQLGLDALFRLARHEGEPAIATCSIGYFDGKTALAIRADVAGRAVASRGKNGFGFDKNFVVDGQSKTYGEMSAAEKDRVSHRAQAIKKLVIELNQL